MKIVIPLGFVLYCRGSHLECIYSLNHRTMLWFTPMRLLNSRENFKSLDGMHSINGSTYNSHAHPQHMNAVEHLRCV
jgi:hypothetical protein